MENSFLDLSNPTSLTQHQHNLFTKLISDIEEEIGKPLTESNLEDRIFSLTGAAGTGKTYLTTKIAKYFSDKYNKHILSDNLQHSFITLTTPTHKALEILMENLRKNGVQANCKTIHSFLGIKPENDYKSSKKTFKIDSNISLRNTTTILIVDESSMVGSSLYKYILDALDDGRIKVVLFTGDPYQLLPVNDSSNSIFSQKNQYVLTEVVRQARDSYIINIATRLRKKIETQNFMDLKFFFAECSAEFKELKCFNNRWDFLEEYYSTKMWYAEDRILTSFKNDDVDFFNFEVRKKYWNEKGIENPRALMPGDRLRFKDAYVLNGMIVYYNNETITIEKSVQKRDESLSLDYWELMPENSRTLQPIKIVDLNCTNVYNDALKSIIRNAKLSPFPDRKKYWDEFYALRDSFANVQYIFASTIHKLQGSTCNTVFVDLNSVVNNTNITDCEKYRLAYVAITRARKDIKVYIPGHSVYDYV